MKKIIILRGFIAAYLAYTSIQILLGLYAEWKLYPYGDKGVLYLNFMNVLIELIQEALLLPTLILLFQTVHYFVKNGYFNGTSATKLKIAGIIFMINAALRYILLHGIVRHVMNSRFAVENKHDIEWIDGLSPLFITLLIGFGLYTLSDFIRRGEAIETENKLTI
jgi:hypothetical protein